MAPKRKIKTQAELLREFENFVEDLYFSLGVPDYVHDRRTPEDDPRVAVERIVPDDPDTTPWSSSVASRAFGLHIALKRTDYERTAKPTVPDTKPRGRSPRVHKPA